MPDNYEPPADPRPWQARRPDWAAGNQPQDLSAHSGQPAFFPADAQARPPDWAAGLGLGLDRTRPPEPSGAAGLNPASWPTPDLYPDHANGHAMHGGQLERRPADRLAYDP